MKLQYTVVSGVRGRHPHNSLNTEHNLPLRVAFAKWGLRNIFGYHWRFHCMSVVPFNERMITNILFPSCRWWEPTIIIFTVTLQTLRQLQTTFAKNWLLICLMPPNFAHNSVYLPVGQLHWSHKHQRNLHWLSRVLREERGSLLRDKSSLIQKRRSVRVSVRKWNRSLQELLRNASKVRKENNTEDGKGTGKQAWENWASS